MSVINGLNFPAARYLSSEFGVFSLKFRRLRRQTLNAVKMVRLSATRRRHFWRHVNIGCLYFSEASFKSATHMQHDTQHDAFPNWQPISVVLGSNPGPKFTDDLRAILRQFSDLRQYYGLSRET